MITSMSQEYSKDVCMKDRILYGNQNTLQVSLFVFLEDDIALCELLELSFFAKSFTSKSLLSVGFSAKKDCHWGVIIIFEAFFIK